MISEFLKNISADQIGFGIFLLCILIQLFYYLFFYARPGLSRLPRKNAPQCPVSVIICAKDEASNLKNFLPSVLTQNYPDYEVNVVNDCSEDDSKDILEELQKKYSHLKVSTIKKDPKFSHGKKFALFIGIKAAKNEWLLLTDADCYPVSPEWLSSMQKNFTTEAEIVLGYGGYRPEPGILNNYIRYDSSFIAMQYFGFALAGIPYMGVGRNLAYRKSLFFKSKGFSSHVTLTSGDDDLFVNKLATGENTKTEYSHGSHIRSIAETTFRRWFKQKKRHLTTGRYYRSRDKILLATESISRVLFYISFIYLVVTGAFLQIVLGLFLFRTVVQGTIYKSALNRLQEKHLLLSSFFYDIISPFLNFGIFIANLSSAERPSWK